MPKHLSYRWIVALFALGGCWDSVATPIRLPTDGAVLAEDAGDVEERDAAANGGPDVPNTPYCQPVADWDDDRARAEIGLYDAINELRAMRPRCGGRDFGELDPGPLWLVPELRCAARLLSRDRATRDSADLPTVEERVAQTGFRSRAPIWASGLSGGTDPDQVVVALRTDWEGCTTLFDPRFTAVGIGLYNEIWTVIYAGR